MATLELIDTHCHLDYDYGPKTREDILREAREAGVTTFITIGVELDSPERLAPLSEANADIWHTVGVHPHEAATVQPGQLEKIRQASHHPRCRAIGEIGLDYHYDHSPRDIQRAVFDEQLKIAREENLPVVIHSRDGEDDLLVSLRAHCAQLPKDAAPGIIHCFSGTREFGEECLKLGFYISFSGIITFKTAEALRECARDFPLDRILVETDSPYLAPVPYRGKKCEPSMVRLTAQKIAEVRGIPLEEVAQATTANARRVFRLPT